MARLADVCEVVMGQAPEGVSYNTAGEGLPLVSGAGDFSGGAVAVKKFTREPTKTSLPGDIIIGVRASIGERVRGDRIYCLGRGVAAVRTRPAKLDTAYLWHVLEAQTALLSSKGKGSTFKQVTRDDVADLSIPVFALPEQRRIAAILDKADAIRARRRAALADAERLPPALFARLARLTGRQRALGEIIKVKSGSFLPASKMATEGPYAVYGGNGVNGMHDTYLFDAPQICIGRVGFYCGAVHRTRPKSWITDNALYVSEMSEELCPDYLEWALRAADLNRVADQAAQPLISGARIYPVVIPVPNNAEQRNFAEQVAQVQRTVSQCEAALADADALYASLAARAFRGEL